MGEREAGREGELEETSQNEWGKRRRRMREGRRGGRVGYREKKEENGRNGKRERERERSVRKLLGNEEEEGESERKFLKVLNCFLWDDSCITIITIEWILV